MYPPDLIPHHSILVQVNDLAERVAQLEIAARALVEESKRAQEAMEERFA